MFLAPRRRYERLLALVGVLIIGHLLFSRHFLANLALTWTSSKRGTSNLRNKELVAKHIAAFDLGLQEIADFEKAVDNSYKAKLQSDLQGRLWSIEEESYHEDSAYHLAIPEYFFGKGEKPITQPFDPRFTIGIYLDHIRRQKLKSPNELVTAPFHWGDWKDLSLLDQYIYLPPGERANCDIINDAIPVKSSSQPAKPPPTAVFLSDDEQTWREMLRLWREYEKYRTKSRSGHLRDEEIRAAQEKVKARAKEKEAADERKEKERIERVANEEKLRKEQLAKEEEARAKETEARIKAELQAEAKKAEDAKMNAEEAKNTDMAKNHDKRADFAEQVGDIAIKPKEAAFSEENDAKVGWKRFFNIAPKVCNDEGEFATLDTEIPPTSIKRGESDRGSKPVDISSYCLDDASLPPNFRDHSGPGFNVFSAPWQTSFDHALLTGKSYLYTLAPPPIDIVFLTKDGSYKVGIDPQMLKLLKNGMVETFIKGGLEMPHRTYVSVLEEHEKLRHDVDDDVSNRIDSFEVILDETDFTFDADATIAEYKNRYKHDPESLTAREMKYFQSMVYAADTWPRHPKHFAEAHMFNNLLGDHYDWRFFDGLKKGKYEQELVLHRLVRVWLSFTRKNGLNTWIAHGSLLSWYWNSIAFPWDDDIDVQMPMRDLLKLSLHFNNTLVVEDTADGLGRYFIDCGSFLFDRNNGNGANVIDARFIDVDTGIYIDITGLAVSNERTPDRYRDQLPEDWKEIPGEHALTNRYLRTYNCRHYHFSSLLELSPLIRTVVEGEHGFVPQKFTTTLRTEYSKGLESLWFGGYVYLRKLRLWVSEKDLYYFLTNRQKWNLFHKYNQGVTLKDGLIVDDSQGHNDYRYEPTVSERNEMKREALRRFRNLEQISLLEELMWGTAGPSLSQQQFEEAQAMSEAEILDLLNKDEIFRDYYASRDATRLHEIEMMNLFLGKSTVNLIASAPDFPPLKYDPFLYRSREGHGTWDEVLERHAAMIKKSRAHKSPEAENNDSDESKPAALPTT